MAASTLNSQAIGIVNQMFSDLNKMYQAYLSVKSDNAQWNNLPNTLAPTLAGFSTTVVAADGQLGAADTTPNTAHVMDVRIYTTLSRGLSQEDIVSLNTFFGAFINLMEGAPVSQQGQAPGLIAKVIGT